MERTGQNATKFVAYIAGPMRGYPENNYPAFMEAKRKLEQSNTCCEIINPAELDKMLGVIESNIDSMTTEEIRRILTADFKHLMKCDYIYMLRNWEMSPGARAEHAIATAFKMYIEYE